MTSSGGYIKNYPEAPEPYTGTEVAIGTGVDGVTTYNLRTGAIAALAAGASTTLFNVLSAPYNAKGIGAANDDTDAIQAAVDAAFAQGGGTVYLPWTPAMSTVGYYNLTLPIQCKPGVSFMGDWRRSKIKNLTDGGAGVGEVFLPGNFHPFYTEAITYDPCVSITPGNAVTLSTPASASKYPVGTQVFVASTGTAVTGSFTIPYYGFLNYVESSDAGTGIVTLRYPIDVAMTGGIAPLASFDGRGSIPLFFWDGLMSDLDVASGTSNWISDSATLGAMFQRLTVSGPVGTYGNCFQHTNWRDCRFFWSKAMGEQSHNSLRTLCTGSEFNFRAQAGVTPVGGLSIQECARYVQYADSKLAMDGIPSGLSTGVISTGMAQNVTFDNIQGTCAGANFTGSFIDLAGTTDPNFGSVDNVVKNSSFDVGEVGRFVIIQGVSETYNTGLGVIDCVFTGATSTNAVWLQDVAGGCTVSGTRFATGNMLVDDVMAGCLVTNNYIDGGFSTEGTSDQAALNNNLIRGNSSAKSLLKQKLLNRIVSGFVSTGTGLTVDVFSADVGASLVYGDTLNFELIATPQGTVDRTVRFHIEDNTASTDTTVATVTIPGTTHSPNQASIKGNITWQQTEILYNFAVQDGDAFAYPPYVGNVANGLTPGDDLSLKIEGGSAASSNGALNFYVMSVGWSNPWYA